VSLQNRILSYRTLPKKSASIAYPRPIVMKVENKFLVPTDYSPIK